MDPSSPPELFGHLAIAVLPALVAAVFATATAACSELSGARMAALRDTLEGPRRNALDRYIENEQAIESRWLTLRVLGIALSAILLSRLMPTTGGSFQPLIATLAALAAYGIPAEIGILIAERTAESSSPLLIRVLQPFELLVLPLAAPIALLGRAVAHAVARRPRDAAVTEQEVELIVNEGEMNGSLAADQGEMIRNVLEFGDLTAGNVMIPRTHVVTIDIGTPLDAVLEVAESKGHSRFPVHDGGTDNVVGIFHVKDWISESSRGPRQKLADVMRKPALFVPAGQSASSVLKDMRSKRQHLAIVLDEFGGMAGIVTLEDLIEEIVGDIQDEHDRDEAPIVDLGDGRLMVDASVSIGDLSRYLGAELPEDGDYNSLGGFIVDRVGRVPPVGASVEIEDIAFFVREADERHVSKVEIVRKRPMPDSMPPKSSRRITAA